MLSPKRALVLAVACTLFLIFFLRSHDDRTLHRADQLPRPNPVVNRVSKVDNDDLVTAVPNPPVLFDPSPPPQYKTPEQLPLSEIRKKPLNEQLAYEFPYSLQGKVPAYIWQTWQTTPSSREFEDHFRELEASWSILHPGFVHEVVTDDVALQLIRYLYASFPEIVEAYEYLPLPVMKSDFFRYLILLARGGIYSDIDTAALKSAGDWVPDTVPRSSYGLVIGIEADPDREDWARWYSRRIQFCQWTIQARPGHPILREVVTNITMEAIQMKEQGAAQNDASVVELTGPAIWTDKIFEFFNNPEYFDMNNANAVVDWKHFTGMTEPKKVGDVVILPITSFSPGIKQMNAGEDDDPMAYVKHYFYGSWKADEDRMIGEDGDAEQADAAESSTKASPADQAKESKE